MAELDKWVAPESTIRVLIDGSLISEHEVPFDLPRLQRLNVPVTTTHDSTPHTVNQLCLDEAFDRVLVLCYRNGMTGEEADARALMTCSSSASSAWITPSWDTG